MSQTKNVFLYLSEFSLALFLFYEQIYAGIGWVFSGTGISFPVAYIRYGFMLIIALGVILTVVQRIRYKLYKDIFILILIFGILYAVSMLNANTRKDILDYNLLFATFLECIPIYILFRYTKDYKMLWQFMIFLSLVMLVVFVTAFFVYNVGSTYTYRTFSAGLTFASLVFLCEWLIEGKKTYALFSLMSFMLIATCGRRSSLVVIALAAILILYNQKRYKYILLFSAVFFLVVLLWKPLFTFLYEFCYAHGVRPRILYRIAIGTISDDSHRFDMWSYVMGTVLSSPKSILFGFGIGGERYYLRNRFIYDWSLSGQVHNILVELIAQFGLIIGSILILYLLVYLPVVTYKKAHTNREMFKLFLFASMMSVSLLFQDDYLKNKFFFMLLAVFGTVLLKNRKTTRRRIPIILQTNKTKYV